MSDSIYAVVLLLWVSRDATNLRRLFLQRCWVQPNYRLHQDLDGQRRLQRQELNVCHCPEVQGQCYNQDFLFTGAQTLGMGQQRFRANLGTESGWRWAEMRSGSVITPVCGSSWAASFSLITISPDTSDSFRHHICSDWPSRADGCRNVIWAGLYCGSEVINIRKR